ncbi:NAD-dependent epimerase/dehydratase family protein [Albimonas pacifica]|uniref:Nucleoside-diphosphate-sugar epimerase n=1 Tax=Albimonas pacifica TaxID=1114924 RepID=A0A1I3BPR5_9RHOB|nr:NAD(P)-dependent oxidoreductase [Albimonas pacifica]SFH64233.1 Nucleoside-diphosphate-sugar epimerase [Albimonas pacifica]
MTRLAAVTGAGGFVGSHVLPALAAAGWRLRILARRSPELAFGPRDPVETTPGSLSDPEALRALVDGADAVIHIAGAVKARSRDGFLAANADGAEAAARAWRETAPGARFVLLSSMAAREPQLSDYAASKREGEARVAAVAQGAPFAVLRPCAVYGPGDRATLPLFRSARLPVQVVPGGEEARICMVSVWDLAAAVAAAVEAPAGIYEVADARTGGYGWREIAAALAAAAGERPEGEADGPPAPARPAPTLRTPRPVLQAVGRLGDLRARLLGPGMVGSGKIREALHPDWSSAPERQLPAALWSARIDLAPGLAATARWYRAQGWLRP